MKYLIGPTGIPTTSIDRDLSDGKSDVSADDLLYSCYIYNRSENAEDRISVFGQMPEDFALNLTSSWESMFDTSLADTKTGSDPVDFVKSVGVKATGINKSVLTGAKTWSGNTEISIDLPVKIQAYDSTRREIMEPLKALLKCASPDLTYGGVLIPPGPKPLDLANLQSLTSSDSKAWASALTESFANTAFYIQIGTWFKMFPCVIENVSVNFDGLVEDVSGHPMFMEVTFQVTSYLTPTKSDIDNWIRIRTAK